MALWSRARIRSSSDSSCAALKRPASGEPTGPFTGFWGTSVIDKEAGEIRCARVLPRIARAALKVRCDCSKEGPKPTPARNPGQSHQPEFAFADEKSWRGFS